MKRKGQKGKTQVRGHEVSNTGIEPGSLVFPSGGTYRPPPGAQPEVAMSVIVPG